MHAIGVQQHIGQGGPVIMSERKNSNEKTAFESLECILDPYTPEQEKDAFERLKAGDEFAEEEITMHNIKLLIDTANKFIKRNNLCHCDRGDVQAVAYEGLLSAIRGFDPAAGNKFSTYAVTCMNRIMQKKRQSFDPYWTMTSKQYKSYMEGQEFIALFEEEYGCRPTEDDIMKALKCKRGTARMILSEKPSVFSVDAPAADGSETSLVNSIADDNPDPEDEAILRALGDSVHQAIYEILDAREREVICRHFAVGCEQDKLSDIARDFGVTPQFVYKLKDRAVAKLAAALDDYKY